MAQRLLRRIAMDQREQSTDAHDTFVELLRKMDLRPLVELICSIAGIELDSVVAIRERTPTIAVPTLGPKPRKRIADLVLIVHGHDERVLAVLVLEVQLHWDSGKRWVWGLLAVAFAADEECSGHVAVLTPDPNLREKLRNRLLPEIVPQPMLIEPHQIPLIHDFEEARRRPRETIFAALYHVAETSESLDSRVAGIRAAVLANRTLEMGERLRYGDVMMRMTPREIMQRALEDLLECEEETDPMEELISDPSTIPELYRNGYLFVRGKEEGIEEGLERGREQGQLSALRGVLVDILAARGVEIADSTRARIDQCQDAATLAQWCTKASSSMAASLAALLDPPESITAPAADRA